MSYLEMNDFDEYCKLSLPMFDKNVKQLIKILSTHTHTHTHTRARTRTHTRTPINKIRHIK